MYNLFLFEVLSSSLPQDGPDLDTYILAKTYFDLKECRQNFSCFLKTLNFQVLGKNGSMIIMIMIGKMNPRTFLMVFILIKALFIIIYIPKFLLYIGI